MLGKLLKYELRSTGRILLPLYPALIFLSIMNRILFSVMLDSGLMDIPRTITTMLYIFLMIATFVITLLVMIQRFHKNLLGEEGYLMFTLPVKTHSHILSKLIVSTIWFVASSITATISIFIMSGFGEWATIMNETQRFSADLAREGISFPLVCVEIIVLMVVCVIYFILSVYSALSIGQLVSKNRILVSFAAYIAISTVLQIIGMIVINILAANDGFINGIMLDTFLIPKNFNWLLLIPIAIAAVLSVGHFFLAKIVLTKKLNIE